MTKPIEIEGIKPDLAAIRGRVMRGTYIGKAQIDIPALLAYIDKLEAVADAAKIVYDNMRILCDSDNCDQCVDKISSGGKCEMEDLYILFTALDKP